jgi:hypothetical protein
MEITLELEDSDLVIEFEPEFDIAINCVDIARVQWKFQDGNYTGAMADVFDKSQDARLPREIIFPYL